MFVERVLNAARRRLVTIDAEASIFEAAGLLAAGTDLLVVCASDQKVVGVITKTDVVKQICASQPVSFATPRHRSCPIMWFFAIPANGWTTPGSG